MGRKICHSHTRSENIMKILVTGATGFIGNYIIKELLKLNKHEIIATAYDDNIDNFKWSKNVRYYKVDLNKSNYNMFRFFEEPDLLIHLAWEGLPNFKELYHFEKNLFSNYFFLKNMIMNGLAQLCTIGTCLEYGLVNGCLSEDLPTNPITAYGLAKDTLRRFLEELSKLYKFQFKWIRLFYLYGKGQSSKSIIPQLDMALDNNQEEFNMSKGDQLRDYLPVNKAAEYIVKISLQNKINGIINCCSGEPISIRDLVENYLKKINKTIRLNLGYYNYPDYEPMAFWGDNSKLKLILSEFR